MTEKFKCIMTALTILFYLATLPVTGFAQTPAQDKTFHEQFMAAQTVPERIKLVEQRVNRLQKALDQTRFDLQFLNGVKTAGIGGDAAYSGATEDRLKETKGRLKKQLADARTRLQGLKNLNDPEFTKAKAKEKKSMQLGKDYLKTSKAHKEGRRTGRMKPIQAFAQLHVLLIVTTFIVMNVALLMPALSMAFSAKLKASRGNEGGSNCFVAGTLVLMADGSYKSIEDIKVGDRVFSRDARSGKDMTAEVYKLLRGKETAVYKFDDGLQVNADHRFYTDKGPVMAGNLKPGAVLLGLEGSRTLCSIDRQGPTLASTGGGAVPSIPVYNIMVRGTHTFFVSPDGHNSYMVLDISACGQ